ncbi:GTPase IMAP family member 4-like [Astyanax mexicanus]|uniref:GTPase IMAP family member 4-like n=1 Tax=Astyanax mexicanus TaxID=7994 RepID=A0A8T2KWZ0_ASTMX|nr:GTPase IMAP family member 4-like [Astyanax mexicanus]
MEELRIVLLGKRGAGKSSAGNTLLGRKPFHAAASSQGVTQTCSKSTITVDGHRISVVDTPGWTDYSLMDDKTILEIAECIALSDPGPHVFLLVLPIGRFTKEEIDTAKQILEVFGKEAHKYHVFNNRDNENQRQVLTLLERIKQMVKTNEGRYYTKAIHTQLVSLTPIHVLLGNEICPPTQSTTLEYINDNMARLKPPLKYMYIHTCIYHHKVLDK